MTPSQGAVKNISILEAIAATRRADGGTGATDGRAVGPARRGSPHSHVVATHIRGRKPFANRRPLGQRTLSRWPTLPTWPYLGSVKRQHIGGLTACPFGLLSNSANVVTCARVCARQRGESP